MISYITFRKIAPGTLLEEDPINEAWETVSTRSRLIGRTLLQDEKQEYIDLKIQQGKE